MRSAISCLIFLAVATLAAAAQSSNAGTVTGFVVDPSGAAVPGAMVSLTGPAGYSHSVKADAKGGFGFTNVPLGTYVLGVAAKGFTFAGQTVVVESPVPIRLNLALRVASANATVQVEAVGATVLENQPATQTAVGQVALEQMPATAPGSDLAAVITNSSPNVAADANGFFHPQGDHAETTYVVDGQPISDQQSKLFSTAIPANALESLDLVTSAPSAAYGDKLGLVVRATTRSGLGDHRPTGNVQAYYGSFGTAGERTAFGIGGDKFGNFLALDGVRSGRFLDAPEFSPMHDIGNNLSGFDRVDWQPSPNDAVHLDLFAARNWFQVPNTYDQQSAGQDQRQRALTFNIAPSYQHIFSPNLLGTADVWLRRDHVNYYPSANPFDDRPATIGQNRFLTNFGTRLDLAYNRWRNNLSAGVQLMQTRLEEGFNLGITDPLFNAICVDASGNPVAAPNVANPSGCAAAGYAPNPKLNPGLVPFDLTRGGQQFVFHGRKNIDEYAAYLQDAINLGNFTLSPGLRVDRYLGLVSYTGWQPRVGGSYLVRPTDTVLRASYSREYESPYNENLILSSATGTGGLATNVFGAFAGMPLQPGRRNDFDLGFEQNITPMVQVSGDYFWKFTNDAFDFDTLFSTPIAFPINWRKSKIDGAGVRVSTKPLHGLSFNATLGHTRSRFFGPENGGIIFNSPLDTGAFRIDHDQVFQQTTEVRYQCRPNIWTIFTWRYDSGLVAGYFAGPNGLANALALDADQQAAIGFFCGAQVATLAAPITSCTVPFPQWGASRVVIPAPGTENDDTNPPRIAPRHLFDIAIGDDSLARTELGRMSARLIVTNLTNRQALYNFLSTFSGTHFVAPRTAEVQLGLTF